MAGNTFSIAIEADISGVKKQLKDLSKTGDAETKKLVKDMSRNLKKAEKAANRLRKSLDGAVTKKAKASFMALKEGAEGFGGALGGSVGMIEKFGKAAGELSSVVGPLGAVVAGAGLAVAGFGFAAVMVGQQVVQAIRASEDWAKELDQLGIDVAPGAVASIEQFNDTLDATVVAMKIAGVALAGDLAGNMQGAAEKSVVAALSIESVVEKALALGSTLTDVLHVVIPFTLAIDAMRDSMLGWVLSTETTEARAKALIAETQAAEKAAKATVAMREAVADAEKSLAEDQRNREKALRRSEKAARESERASLDAAKEEADADKAALDAAQAKQDAQQALANILKRSASDQLSDSGKIVGAHVARLAAIENVMIVANDAALAQAAADASEQRMIRETSALRISETVKAADAATAAIQGYLDQIKGGQADQAEALADTAAGLGILSDGFGTAGAAIDLMAQAQAREAEAAQLGIDAVNERTQGEKDLIKAKIESGALTEKEGQLEIAAIKAAAKEDRQAEKRKLKEAKKNAKKLFKLSKAASLAEVVFGTAAAVLQAYAMFGPPPSPLGVAGAAAALATGLVQAATIAAEQPPSFAAGGLVSGRASGDHVPILASRNEGIVSPRGMAALGADGLNALNAGGGMAATTNVYIGGKLIEAMTVDALTSPAAAAVLDVRSGLPTGQVLVYGRG